MALCESRVQEDSLATGEVVLRTTRLWLLDGVSWVDYAEQVDNNLYSVKYSFLQIWKWTFFGKTFLWKRTYTGHASSAQIGVQMGNAYLILTDEQEHQFLHVWFEDGLLTVKETW
jgi:hypothetical protein